MPVIEEVEEESPVIEYSNENKTGVSGNIFSKQANKLCRRETVHVVENLNDKDHVVESDSGTVTKVKDFEKLYRKENFEERPAVKEDDITFEIPGKNENIDNGHLRFDQIEESKTDSYKNCNVFHENNGNIDKRYLSKEYVFLKKIINTAKANNANLRNQTGSMYVGKTMMDEEKISSEKCGKIKMKRNTLKTGEIKSPLETNAIEDTTIIPLREELHPLQFPENAIAVDNENQSSKVPSQVTVIFTTF